MTLPAHSARKPEQMVREYVVLRPNRDHCIETVARQEHRAVLTELLATGNAAPALTAKFELLTLFLKTADFRKLRAETENLRLGNNHAEVTLKLSRGRVSYQIKPGPKDT